MIANRHVEKLVAAVVAAALALCLLAMGLSDALREAAGGSSGLTMEYETALFGAGAPLAVEIDMEESDWEAMLADAISETYYTCDVTINGTTFHNVGIRPKGNTSLSAIYNDDTTDRYSFKLEFDQFVEGQSCFGLDKLVLNNNYADATSMKEAVVYDMFAFLGADAPLYTYAQVSVNGSYWGCYLALEAVEESFALRNYGTSYGQLYKPESMGGGGAGGMRDVDSGQLQEMLEQMGGDFPAMPEEGAEKAVPESGAAQGDNPALADGAKSAAPGGEEAPAADGAGESPPETGASGGAGAPAGGLGKEAGAPATDGRGQRGGMRPEGGGPGGMSGGGADLNYVDDDLDSYSTIWDGEVFSSKKADHRRVVDALKHISQREDLESYLDVDNLLRYLAVQTFVVNLDGLAGNMAHNYYLYEEDGQLNLIPWDYNLAFGGFQGGDASSTVNFPIDTPFTTGLEDRDFFAALLEDEANLTQYHAYLQQLSEEYVGGGVFADTVARIRGQIDSLVAADPTAFYSADEYEAAVEMLETVVALRARSVLGQLEGAIPSTTEGQQADGSALVPTEDVVVSVMGTMSMGGGPGGGFPGGGQPPAGGRDGGAVPGEVAIGGAADEGAAADGTAQTPKQPASGGTAS